MPKADLTEVIAITPELTIPRDELRFRFTRSGGPGGQHANRSSTQVELAFDILRSPSLDAEQTARLIRALNNRIDQNGILHLSSRSTRSQYENREDVTARFARLMAAALKPTKARKPTRPARAARERRLRTKRARSVVKQRRVSARDME